MKYSFFFNPKANNSVFSGRIRPIIEPIRDFMVIYILTKFGADWLIVVDVSRRPNIDGISTTQPNLTPKKALYRDGRIQYKFKDCLIRCYSID